MLKEMTPEQFEELKDLLGLKAQHAARIEDAVMRVEQKYEDLISAVVKLLRQGSKDCYMDAEDYLRCEHCGERIFCGS